MSGIESARLPSEQSSSTVITNRGSNGLAESVCAGVASNNATMRNRVMGVLRESIMCCKKGFGAVLDIKPAVRGNVYGNIPGPAKTQPAFVDAGLIN